MCCSRYYFAHSAASSLVPRLESPQRPLLTPMLSSGIGRRTTITRSLIGSCLLAFIQDVRALNKLYSRNSHSSLPLGLHVPAALLLSVRFGPPIDANQESRDDYIDQTPALSFWFHWVFVPWWPIKNIALTEFRNAHTYLDDIFLMLSWGGVALDVIISVVVSFLLAITDLLFCSTN